MATRLKTVEDALNELPTGLALLRAPFPPHQISKLPKETKAQATQRKKDQDAGNWPPKCTICEGYHHPKAVHLDYVGHAALTDRLLDVDPNWSWEPMGTTPEGLPAINGGLWIKLTVCGVSRYGFGAADGKVGGDAVKEMIGDALRNAAMRFGAALDLWHKGDLHTEDDGPKADPITTGETPANKRVALDGPYTSATALKTAAREFVRTLEGIGDLDEFIAWSETTDYREFCDQLAKDMPSWWMGGPDVPAEFVPLEIRIRQRREDLEKLEGVR
jgi:hypothetical protein